LAEALSFVVAVIMNGKNELLLLKRSESARRDPGKWGLSGGRLEADESAEEGMVRELAEELGDGLVLRLESRLEPLPAIGSKGGTVHLFHYTLLSGSLILNAEHTDYKWVDQDEYRDMDLMPGVDADLTYFGIWPGRRP
jgi:8-oxo-dGTP pyrophosphatase MutT (NUDIX family)